MFTGEALAKYCATGLRELCKAAGETYDPTLISAHQPRERYLHKNSTSIDDDDDDDDDGDDDDDDDDVVDDVDDVDDDEE